MLSSSSDIKPSQRTLPPTQKYFGEVHSCVMKAFIRSSTSLKFPTTPNCHFFPSSRPIGGKCADD